MPPFCPSPCLDSLGFHCGIRLESSERYRPFIAKQMERPCAGVLESVTKLYTRAVTKL